MAKSYSRYEYETSPRKLEPNYNVPKKSPTKKKTQAKRNVSKKKQKELKRKKIKTTLYVLIAFSIVFLVSYRNAKIDEKFAEVRSLKEEMEKVEKENAQLEVSIESSLNLTNIEQQAKSLLGMQKLTSRQTEYIELPKTDYIEPAAENVVLEEEKGFLEKVGDFIFRII
jgi:cell division protein FtsL